MRTFWLGTVFVLSFLGFLVARLPLEPVVGALGLEGQGVQYSRAVGSVWSGKITGLRVGEQQLGALTFGLLPRGVLVGQLRADVDLTGPAMSADGQIGLRLPGVVMLDDVEVEVNLSRWMALHPRLRSPGAQVSVAIDTWSLTQDSPCLEAVGRVRSDALVDFQTDIRWSGPPLAGDIVCQDGVLVVSLSGAQDDAQIDAIARVAQGFASSVLVELNTPSDQIGIFALSFGFEERDGGYIYAFEIDGL